MSAGTCTDLYPKNVSTFVGQRSLLRWATKPIALGNEAHCVGQRSLLRFYTQANVFYHTLDYCTILKRIRKE